MTVSNYIGLDLHIKIYYVCPYESTYKTVM